MPLHIYEHLNITMEHRTYICFSFFIFRKEQASILYQNITIVEPLLIQQYEHVIRNFVREIRLQSTEMENLAIAVKRYLSTFYPKCVNLWYFLYDLLYNRQIFVVFIFLYCIITMVLVPVNARQVVDIGQCSLKFLDEFWRHSAAIYKRTCSSYLVTLHIQI